MIRPRLLVVLTTMWFGPALGYAAEKPGPRWPSAPIAVSPTEGVIEAFWLRRVKPAERWKASGGSVSTGWDASVFRFEADEPGDVASMTRTYDIDLTGYRRIRMRLRPGEAVRTTIVGTVDGREHAVVDAAAGSNDAFELVGSIRGEKLTGLTVKFLAEQPGVHNVQLRWILLEKDGTSWTPPEDPFEGMIVEEAVGRFEPGLGLLFGAEELDRLRQVVQSPVFETVWQADLQRAANQYQVDPASLIRPYSLYAFARYGRDTDAELVTVHDGIILAQVGLLTRNEDYLRQAARHAIAVARIDHWSEGFVDRMPGYYWYHSGFAPNVATIKASLLLDWTWHYLTPDGRKLIREAIAKKGLQHVERAKDAMANQGVRFNKGMILGKMALADSLDDSELRKYVRACIDRINGKLNTIVRPDGTFSEAMNYYGKGTMSCTPISYHAASRCLGAPIAELVSPRMLPSMRYILTADGRLNAGMAAFCAGPLGDEKFASQCVPTGLLHDFVDTDFPTLQHESNRIEFIFFGLAPLWAPKLQKSQQQPSLPPLSVYRDGGWVFGGSDDPVAPRFSFESGLWDGHGHAWFHKNAITLDGWGERQLVSRFHLGYQDARSQYTMQTKLYNTFAPSGRNQNASRTRGRGAKLLAAEDLGPVAIVESDNATAWRSGVKRAVRRVLFIRPNVLIIHDDAEFTKPEPGVQSWNSFQPWKHTDDSTCESRIGKTTVRLTALTSQPLQLTSGQDSVSREGNIHDPIEVPVYRAAFTTDGATQHSVITIVEAIGPDGSERPVVGVRETDQMVEIRSAGRVVQILTAHDKPTVGPLAGFASDGRFVFTVREKGEFTHAGTFGATWMQTPEGRIKGKGFLRWPATSGGATKSRDEAPTSTNPPQAAP